MLCPSVIYNITKVPPYTGDFSKDTTCETNAEMVHWIKSALELDYRGHNLTRYITSIHQYCSDENREVLSWVLARKNPAKISASLVNKVWPGLIRTQRYMGAVPGTQEALERLFNSYNSSNFVHAQTKEDGMCLLVDYERGVPTFGRTRQGNDIGKYFPEFMGSLPRVSEFNGMLHMELFVDVEDRQTGNGLINKQIKNATVGGLTDFKLRGVLLDLVDDDLPEMTQESRYNSLRHFCGSRTRVVFQREVRTLEDARKLCSEVVNLGGEGLVLKHPKHAFKDGKPWFSVKLKNEFKVTLKCTGVVPHKTLPGLIGSLQMESLDGTIKVNVGSGLTDELRGCPWDTMVGLLIDVTANSIIHSKGKKVTSLYLPRFDRKGGLPVRYDKDRPDSYAEILNEERMHQCVQLATS